MIEIVGVTVPFADMLGRGLRGTVSLPLAIPVKEAHKEASFDQEKLLEWGYRGKITM